MEDISVKLYDVNGGDVRRFPFQIPKDPKTSYSGIYNALLAKIGQIYSINKENSKLRLAWKDDEADLIVMNTDEEVKEAVRQIKGGIFRVFVRSLDDNNDVDSPRPNEDTKPKKAPIDVIIGDNVPLDDEPQRHHFEEEQVESPPEPDIADQSPPPPPPAVESDTHGGIICDGCDKHGIQGARYKCLSCPDFDLCSVCESKRIHDEHPMIRIPKPNDNSWQSAFFAAQGMNRFVNFRGGRRGRCQYGGGGHHRRSGQCAQAAPEQGQQQEQQQRPQQQHELPGGQFLRDVGQAVAAVLNGFGIDVDIDVEHPNGQRTKVASPKTNDPMPPTTQQSEKQAETPVVPVDQPMENVTSPPPQAAAAVENMETGQITPDGHLDWMILDSADVAASQETKPMALATAPPATQSANPRLDAAVAYMLGMGFTNEGGWLTQLLEAKNCDIGAVLEILHPSEKP